MERRILLAEDNRQLATTISKMLQAKGFRVEHRADGIEALKSLAAASPDLLLLDLKLPGLSGVEILKKIRHSPRTAKLPVIIMTGVYQGEKFHNAARQLGVDHYLEKPFKASTMMAAIQQLLPAAQAADGESSAAPFVQHLRTAFQKNYSGQLVLTYPDTVRTLTFINGAPVALRPGYRHRDFGDYLHQRQLISDTEYDFFTTRGGFRHASLVQMGCLEYGDLLQAELDFLEGELVAAFGAGPAVGRWRALPLPELQQLITINVPQLFYDGFHRHLDETGKRLADRLRNKFVAIGQNYYRHINFLSLAEDEKSLLLKLDGQRRVDELLTADTDYRPLLLTLNSLGMLSLTPQPGQAAQPDDVPVRKLFNAVDEELEVQIDETLESFSDLVEDEEDVPLAAARAVSPSAPPGPTKGTDDLGQEVRLLAKSLEGQNHYQVFGIKPARFSIDLLKERYFAITRNFGPEVLMQLGGEEAALVEQILSTVATAYDTLSDVVKKERYDEMLNSEKIGLGREGDDRFQAEVQAESGKVFIDMEDWDSAEKALQGAVNFNPDSGDYLASLAWTIYRNPKYAHSQAMRTKAKQMLNKALTLDRVPHGYAYKGWILLEAGQESLAEAEFNKALKLDARQVMARKGLRTLQEKREQQKKGLFKRMFK